MAMELAQVPKMLMLLRHLWAPMAFCVSFKVFSYFLISALWTMTAYKSPADGLLVFKSNFQKFVILQCMWIAVKFTVLTILKWRFLCNILVLVLYGGPHGWMGEAHMTTSCISSIWEFWQVCTWCSVYIFWPLSSLWLPKAARHGNDLLLWAVTFEF